MRIESQDRFCGVSRYICWLVQKQLRYDLLSGLFSGLAGLAGLAPPWKVEGVLGTVLLFST